MKNEPILILLSILLLVLILFIPLSIYWVCENEKVKIEYSEIITEPATVKDLIHTPQKLGIIIYSPVMIWGETTSESYAIVFKLRQKEITVNCTLDTGKMAIWKRLKNGQKVIVEYQEIYKVIYLQGKPVGKDFQGINFVNAK